MTQQARKQEVFVGVDVGGTKIGINAIDQDRKPVSPAWNEVPSLSAQGPRATVGQIVLGLQQFIELRQISLDEVVALGVDSPGPGDINGVLERSANMHPDWEGFHLREEVQRAVSAYAGRGVPVSYENDCNAAAYWESFRGCPGGTEVMALMAPGTGLGGGIVINGRLLRGARGMGAELGHVEIVHRPFVPGHQVGPCGCGQQFCAEAYVSLAALARLLPAALQQPEWRNHPLNEIDGDDKWRKRAFQVRGLAVKGDDLCRRIFQWQSQAIGRLCRQVCNTLDPNRLVIGGGFIEGSAELTDMIMRTIRETFRTLAFKKHAREVVIETASAGDQAGCLGAALSAWDRYQIDTGRQTTPSAGGA